MCLKRVCGPSPGYIWKSYFPSLGHRPQLVLLHVQATSSDTPPPSTPQTLIFPTSKSSFCEYSTLSFSQSWAFSWTDNKNARYTYRTIHFMNATWTVHKLSKINTLDTLIDEETDDWNKTVFTLQELTVNLGLAALCTLPILVLYFMNSTEVCVNWQWHLRQQGMERMGDDVL